MLAELEFSLKDRLRQIAREARALPHEADCYINRMAGEHQDVVGLGRYTPHESNCDCARGRILAAARVD